MSALAPLSDVEIAEQEDAYVAWLAEQRGCSLEEARVAARKPLPVRYETIRRFERVEWPDNVVCLDSRRAS